MIFANIFGVIPYIGISGRDINPGLVLLARVLLGGLRPARFLIAREMTMLVLWFLHLREEGLHARLQGF